MEDNNTTEDLFQQTILVERITSKLKYMNAQLSEMAACGADYANKLISTFGHSLHKQLELFEKEMIELELSSTVENTQILPQDDADEQAN
ncbi:RAS protein [Trichinella spiralis]|uniref:RAS protein n=1 Tax=Trichinella spiralis TaxID=6334 RepID=A0ABR3KIK9_TRISP